MSDTNLVSKTFKQRENLTQRINRPNRKGKTLKNKNTLPLKSAHVFSSPEIYCTLTIETQNVQGFREKKQWLQDFKRPGGPSILGLQETHIATPVEAEKLKQDFLRIMGYNNTTTNLTFLSLAPERRGGVGILINPSATFITEVKPFLQDKWSKRFISISFKYHEQKWIYINIYASNMKAEREAFFQEIINIEFPPNFSILFGGDFNVVIDKNETSKVNESPKLEELLCKHQLTDPHTINLDKYLQENKPYRWQKYATWQRQNTYRRLDRIYISASGLKQVHSLQTEVPPVASDHKRLSLHIHPNKSPHAIRKNVPIYPWFGIQQSDKDQISTFIKEASVQIIQQSTPNRWQEIKYKIIKLMKKLRQSSIHKTKSTLRSKIRKLQIKLELSQPIRVRPIQNRIHQLQSKWRSYKMNMKIGERISTGEHSNKSFFRRINSKFTKSPILELETPSGTVHHAKILPQAMGQGWQEIMNPKRERLNLYKVRNFLTPHPNPLNSRQQQELIQPFKEDEVLEVFRTLKTDKAPGPDGLINNWYKDFSEDLIPIFYTLTNHWLQTQQVPEDFSSCVVTSLKKAANSRKPLDFRPISLLNTDYKILTKLIANRVKDVLPQIIHTDQAGFVPGRRMEESISKVLLAQELGSFRNTQLRNRGVLLMVDFSKAYDSLIRSYLWETLKWAGFPDQIIRLISMTYTKTTAKFLINGFSSGNFPVTSGIRQGCPLAPLLFIIAMETIMTKIRKDNGIRGITFRVEGKKIELRTTGFVDDLCIFLSRSKQLPTALALLKAFGRLSGLKINLKKSNGLWLDKDQTIPEAYGISFLTNKDTVRYLGIQVGPGSSASLNWNTFISKSQTRLFLASTRTNSLKGRVTILNAIFMAGIRFLAEFFPPSSNTITHLENIMQNFLKHFSLQREKLPGRLAISLQILELPTKSGGLGLQNLKHELNKVYLSKTIRWLHQPLKDIFFIKRMLLAIDLKKSGETYFGGPEIPFSLSLSTRRLRGHGIWLTGVKQLQTSLTETLSPLLLKVQEAQTRHLQDLQDLYTLRFAGTTAILEFSPWLKPKILEQHKLLQTAISPLIPKSMLIHQNIFDNPLIRLEGKTLKALDFINILPACCKIQRLTELQEYPHGLALTLYTYSSTYSLTKRERTQWEKIIKALWQSFPMLCLPKASREVTLLTTNKAVERQLLPTSYPTKYIEFNPQNHTTREVEWDTNSLSFTHKHTSTQIQITPHPIFSRLHFNIPYHPHKSTTSIRKNQWWNSTWVKKWGKKQYTKEVNKVLRLINTSWKSEHPAFTSACRDIKPKFLWASGTGTPSMQFLQYRMTIHRLPTWSSTEKGRCKKCSGAFKDNLGHIFWDCHKHIWKLFVWVWAGKRVNLDVHWQYSLMSGKMSQPPGSTSDLEVNKIYTSLDLWGKCWPILTSATKSHIWYIRNQRVHEEAKNLIHLQGRCYLKQIASRIRQMRSHDIPNWEKYTLLLKRTKSLPLPRDEHPNISMLAYFDGGSRQNPGTGGAGSWELQTTKHHSLLFLQSLRPFIPVTNNEAEVMALLNILHSNKQRNIPISSTVLQIMGDSNILIQALNGRSRIKNKKLTPFFYKIQYLLAEYHTWRANHTKRAGNKLADYLANIAMDSTDIPFIQSPTVIKHLKNDLDTLGASPLAPSLQEHLRLQALIPSNRFTPRIFSKLSPFQTVTTRREANELGPYPSHRATHWSTVCLGTLQLPERSGLQPSGIG